MKEINFDGIVGPTHNYAGLSDGNLAAARNAGRTSRPRAAALQGIAKMRGNLRLGLLQGILLPHARPDHAWLAALGRKYDNPLTSPTLRAQALSASAMWAANAATVSPAPDTEDGRCHLSVANLVTMPHRSHEWPETLRQLRLAFAHPVFVVHAPVPPPFGDEGAANHMRLAPAHDQPGMELFCYGVKGGPHPIRQHREASEAVARRHRLSPDRAWLVRQSEAAIAAGAFHNDVVAVANERILFAHEQAFDEGPHLYEQLRRVAPWIEIVEVPSDRVSLADAVASYLFNAQLATLPGGEAALILPGEAREHAGVWAWLTEMVAGNGPIRRLEIVDVRESMANGGGPACLRLRVVADPATVDPRFLVDEAKLDRLVRVIERWWPEEIATDAIGNSRLVAQVERARAALLEDLDLAELI